MANIKLVIAYEGTRYLGWQKTKCGPSVEESLEKALSQILQEKIDLQAASRTDAGVHAEGQVVNFITDKDCDLSLLQRGANALLPKDISILSIEIVPDAFHPTLDCSGKEYHYYLCMDSAQSPFFRNFSWHFPKVLDIETMQRASEVLLGVHDYSAFCNERSLCTKDTVRELYKIEFVPLSYRRLKIAIAGNHFLYKMVRNIVGTLVYIGCGKLTAEELPEILRSKDRTKAGPSAPAHGLTLKEVFYSVPVFSGETL